MLFFITVKVQFFFYKGYTYFVFFFNEYLISPMTVGIFEPRNEIVSVSIQIEAKLVITL